MIRYGAELRKTQYLHRAEYSHDVLQARRKYTCSPFSVCVRVANSLAFNS